MLLSDLEKIGFFKVVRDASFDTPGFASDPQKDMLTFLESNRYTGLINNLKGLTCIITKKELVKDIKGVKGVAVSNNPRLSFYKVHNYLTKEGFYWKDFPTQIDKTAKVHPKAIIAENNVRIDQRTIVGAGVIISERCIIGKDVQIMPGVILGSVGLQVTRFKEGVIDMNHAGGIKINNNVQIMSGAVIASAVFGQLTNIGEDSRIGNLAFISHNTQVGPRCLIGHGAVINGNVRIGKDAWIGPGAVISNNIIIGNNAYVCLGSIVIDNVKAGMKVLGPVALDKKKMINYMNYIREKNV